MKDKITIAAILLLAVLTNTNSVLAHEGNRGKNEEKAEIKIEARGENEFEIENEDDDDDNNINRSISKLEVSDSKFEISGEITSISGNAFVVLGQTITIDPSKVSEFEQKGILEVGKKVKVEGIIQNDTKFAREIMVIGTGQGRFKFEINGQTISLSPTISISPTGSPSPTIITPTSTQSSSIKVNVKARGSVDAITKFFEQILSFLKNLI